jgi:hypothetical protein
MNIVIVTKKICFNDPYLHFLNLSKTQLLVVKIFLSGSLCHKW